MKKGIWVFFIVVCFACFSFGQDQQQSKNGIQPQSKNGTQLPPELANGQAPKILGYDVAPTEIDRDELELGGYPTNASLGYKGVVMANFNAADAADEIACDFGSLGLWIYDSGVWRQLSTYNPEAMISVTWGSATDDELIVDFGSLGLWRWDHWGSYPGTWAHWTGVNPGGIFATDDDNDGLTEVHCDFGSLGVWRLDDDGPWTQLSGLDPYNGLRMDTFTYGYEEACWSFPSVGVWRIFDASGPLYTHLTGTVNANDDHASAQFTNTSGAEDLVMDFASLGLWLLEEDSHTAWHQISTMSVNRLKEVKFVGAQDYELIVEDNAGGLYWGNWNGSSFTWYLISSQDTGPGSAFCETFDYDGTDGGDEEVIIPWTSGGASIFDYSAGGTLTLMLNTSYYVRFMVKGDYYGRGYDSTMAFVFSSSSPYPGLWLYDQVNGYVQLTGEIPDGVY